MNKSNLKIIIISILFQIILTIICFNIIIYKIKNKEIIYNLYLKIIIISVLYYLILNLIKSIQSKKIKDKYSKNFIIYFINILISFMISNFLIKKYPKKKIYELLKYDLLELNNFLKMNKKISSPEELYQKTIYLLKRLSFDDNYVLNDNFLYIFKNRPNILYYYLAKYPNDCSYHENLTIKFELEELNPIIEIINKKIKNRKESIEFIRKLIKNYCKKKRFIFFYIKLAYHKEYQNECKDEKDNLFLNKDKSEYKYDNHAIIIILDTLQKKVEYFDSNLYQNLNDDEISDYSYKKCDKERIKNILENYFEDFEYKEESFDNEFIENFGSQCFEKKIIGLQKLDINETPNNDSKNIEKEGYCMNWVWYYLDERLKIENRNLTKIEIIKKIIKEFKTNSDKSIKSYIGFIRSFAVFQKVYNIISNHYNIYFSLKEIGEIAVKLFTND